MYVKIPVQKTLINSLTKLSLRFPMVKPDSDFQNLSNITFKVNQVESSTTVHTVVVSQEFFFLRNLCTPGKIHINKSSWMFHHFFIICFQPIYRGAVDIRQHQLMWTTSYIWTLLLLRQSRSPEQIILYVLHTCQNQQLFYLLLCKSLFVYTL